MRSDADQEAYITLPVRADQIVITSEKGLYALVRNRNNVEYDARKKELTLKNDFFATMLGASIFTALGGVVTFVGVKSIQEADLYLEPMKQKLNGVLCLLGSCVLYLAAGLMIMDDYEIKLSPEGIKLGKKDYVKWDDVRLSLSGEIYEGRARAIVQLDVVIKSDGLEKKEALCIMKEGSSKGVTFSEFLGIIKYYMETYSGDVNEAATA